MKTYVHSLQYLAEFNLHYILTKIMGTLHEDLCTFITVSRRILLRIKELSEKNCREIQNTYFILTKFFFPPKS